MTQRQLRIYRRNLKLFFIFHLLDVFFQFCRRHYLLYYFFATLFNTGAVILLVILKCHIFDSDMRILAYFWYFIILFIPMLFISYFVAVISLDALWLLRLPSCYYDQAKQMLRWYRFI